MTDETKDLLGVHYGFPKCQVCTGEIWGLLIPVGGTETETQYVHGDKPLCELIQKILTKKVLA